MAFAGNSSPQTPTMSFPAAAQAPPPRPAAARKALRASCFFGTAEAVPLQRNEFFSKLKVVL
jgi:hypothetical protein